MKTTENNKLIAEFMGAKKTHIQSVGDIYCPVPSKSGSEYADKLQYHKSWDWLMPVVNRINETHEVLIGRISCQINEILDRDNPICSMVCGDISKKHETVYQAVVQFINQYNNQQL